MSFSAPGTFTRNSANRVTAVFVIDGIQHTYTATVSPSVPAFTSHNAKVHYNDKEELTSTRPYHGRIGTETFELTLDNGVKIDGRLNVPGISPAMTVTGNGNWEQN